MNILTAIKSKFIKLPEKYDIPEEIVEKLEDNCSMFDQHGANKIINEIRPQLEKLYYKNPTPNNKKDFIGPPKPWKKEYENVLKEYLSKFYSAVDKSGYMINQFNNILNSTDYDFKFCQDIKCSTTGFNRDTDKYEIFIKIPENSDFEQSFRECVHELAHAMCQRSTTTHAPQRVSLFEEDKSGVCGEIESLFMEKVADKFMLDEGIIDALNPDKHIHNLTNSINEILPTNDILNSISAPITKSKIDTFFKRCIANKDSNIDRFSEEIQKLANDPDNRALFRLRYVYGEVVSTNLFANYLSDPESTMANFSNYIQNNDGIEIDKACETLLGQGKTFVDATNSYNPMANQRINIKSNTQETDLKESNTLETNGTQETAPPTSDSKSM